MDKYIHIEIFTASTYSVLPKLLQFPPPPPPPKVIHTKAELLVLYFSTVVNSPNSLGYIYTNCLIMRFCIFLHFLNLLKHLSPCLYLIRRNSYKFYRIILNLSYMRAAATSFTTWIESVYNS